MTILFTADWHIDLRHKKIPQDWNIERYRSLIRQVAEIEHDLHIIGGDLFDRLPNMEELSLYFELVKAATKRTLIYSGNHEASKKGETFFKFLAEATRLVNPLVSVVLGIWELVPNEEFPDISGTIVPYEFISKRSNWEQLDTSKPVFTHVRGAIEPHVKPEIPLGWLSEFPVVFAGDLHSHSNSQANIIYPGEPMTTSFHRSRKETGYLLIDGVDWQWRAFKIPQLIRKTVSDSSEIIPTEYDYTIYELTGDLEGLTKVDNSIEVLDKKIIRRSSDTTLLLDPDMTLAQELQEYLVFILDLPDNKVASILGVFNDHIG